MGDVRKVLGQRISHYRDRNGYSQIGLAEKLDVDKGTVWRWEEGRTWPKYDQLTAMAGLFGIEVEAFFSEMPQDDPLKAAEKAIKLATKLGPDLVVALSAANKTQLQFIRDTLASDATRDKAGAVLRQKDDDAQNDSDEGGEQ